MLLFSQLFCIKWDFMRLYHNIRCTLFYIANIITMLILCKIKIIIFIILNNYFYDILIWLLLINYTTITLFIDFYELNVNLFFRWTWYILFKLIIYCTFKFTEHTFIDSCSLNFSPISYSNIKSASPNI